MAKICVVAENRAEVKCFKVDKDFKADLKVFFVDKDFKAKWKKPHKLQNRL